MQGYLGEIRLFAGPRIPQKWVVCDGKVLQIADNHILYSFFGTEYRGDGRMTFALPKIEPLPLIPGVRGAKDKLNYIICVDGDPPQ